MEKGDTLTQNREEDKPVELRVLRYFLAVARMQSISAAAEELHITQPTLSRQLMELEEELGAKLFDRGRKNRRVALTEAGKRLHRQGQVNKVIIHHLVSTGTRDEDVMAALRRKDDVQNWVMESLKARIRRIRDGH